MTERVYDQREDLHAANMFRLTASKSAVVQDGYHWRLIDSSTPRGAKLQLINKYSGVTTYGTLAADPGYWTHWAPLPTWAKPIEEVA